MANRVGNQCSVVGVPLTGEFKAAGCDVVFLIGGIEPYDKGFNHKIEEKWGEGVSLEGPPSDFHRGGVWPCGVVN